jgi:hypothetical protein
MQCSRTPHAAPGADAGVGIPNARNAGHSRKSWESVFMNTISKIGVLLVLVLAPFSTFVSAEDAQGDVVQQNQAASTGFAYRPPMRGAPASRVGGASRGVGDADLEVSVLAPDHTGLTTKSQPTLYWYLSKPANARLDVTVINNDEIDPLLEKAIGIPKRAGIQQLDLSEAGTRLEPGIEYRWFVSIIPDEEQRSNDIVASGTIEYTAPDADLERRIAASDEREQAAIFAENGLWYDAIDSLSHAIENNPDDASLRALRAAMLEQVGLNSVAAYDSR